VGLSPWFLPAAYLAHALWDLAHHNRSNLKLVSITQWYIPWCVIIDVIVGLDLIAIWHWNGVL
jgi:RsiW-degrading membrane proteinase PrsW (M82 family)